MAEETLDTLDTGTDAPASDDLRSDIADAFDAVESRETVAEPAPTSPSGSPDRRCRRPTRRRQAQPPAHRTPLLGHGRPRQPRQLQASRLLQPGHPPPAAEPTAYR